jgi:uncharacterized RDD family membrane protein YckC
MSDTDLWYFEAGAQQRGPIPFSELQQMVAGGRLQPSQLVWTSGMANWAPASSIEGLFPAAVDTVATAVAAAPAADATVADTVSAPIIPHAPPVEIIGYYAETQRFHYAGFWIRVLATIIDGMLLSFMLILLALPLLAVIDRRTQSLRGWEHLIPLGIELGYAVTGWLYFALMESSPRQATLGKLALRLKVVDVHGARISFGRASGRFFSKIISYLPLYIGFILAAFMPRKQALHDLICQTMVIRPDPARFARANASGS